MPVHAECNKPVTTLEQGAPAPCRGYLFTPEKQREVQLMNEDYSLVKESLELKNLKIKSYVQDQKDADFIIAKEREQSELWRKRAEESTLLLTKKEDSQGRRDWIMLLLGVAITVGAGYAVGQASK